MFRWGVVILCALAMACKSPVVDVDPDTDTDTDVDTATEPLLHVATEPDVVAAHPNTRVPPDDAEGCHGLYAQDIVPAFELTIAPAQWAALVDEWENGVENEMKVESGELEDYNPYHPVELFRYQDIEIADAMVRLRGNPNYWRSQNKLQMQVSFNEHRSNGRFLGLRKVIFDAATYNRTFLRDRLALSILRDAGVTAPCANSARVSVNGSYYGLFTNIERLDKEYLQRRYDEPDGDLWKRASWELRTNKDAHDDARLDQLRDAKSVPQLSALLDLQAARMMWAVDAVIPNSDGPFAGGLNFYLYDDPATGKFELLIWDLDNTFWRLPFDTDPYTWHKEIRYYGRPMYDMALADSAQFSAYVADIDEVLDFAYSPERVTARIDAWTAQIQEHAFEDPNKPFSNARYLEAVGDLRLFVQRRHRHLRQWTECWKSGGTDDGQGHCVEP